MKKLEDWDVNYRAREVLNDAAPEMYEYIEDTVQAFAIALDMLVCAPAIKGWAQERIKTGNEILKKARGE